MRCPLSNGPPARTKRLCRPPSQGAEHHVCALGCGESPCHRDHDRTRSHSPSGTPRSGAVDVDRGPGGRDRPSHLSLKSIPLAVRCSDIEFEPTVPWRSGYVRFRGHSDGTSSLQAAQGEIGETLVPQGLRPSCGFSGAGLLIRKLRVRVPPPEPIDRRKPIHVKGFRLQILLGQSGDSA